MVSCFLGSFPLSGVMWMNMTVEMAARKPRQRYVPAKAAMTSCADVRGMPSVNSDRMAAAMATPMLMESCMMTDRGLFPLLAYSSDRSKRVTVFMAVNCVELMMPKMVKMNSMSQ